MIDLITVVFKPELYFLQIQARSIEHYIDSKKINKIFVVVNDQKSVCSLIDKNWYGANSDKVEIISAADKFGSTDNLDGWSSQQYYKLACAEICESAWSVCLDAKTWFITPIDWHKLFDYKNRPRFHPLKNIENFNSAKKFVDVFFDLDKEDSSVIGPAGVPFFFATKEIKELFKFLENRKINFHSFFTEKVQEPTFLTEFVLYSGWIKYLYKGFDRLYNSNQYYQPVNVADFQKDKFREVFLYMLSPNTLTVSIHRSVYENMIEEEWQLWLDFLETRDLSVDRQQLQFSLLNTVNVE